jgi:hypothetical protein
MYILAAQERLRIPLLYLDVLSLQYAVLEREGCCGCSRPTACTASILQCADFSMLYLEEKDVAVAGGVGDMGIATD